MSAFYRKGPSRCARKQLTLEHLETRQLMAADLASTAFPLGPMDAQNDESVQGTQAQTASVRHATHARPNVPNNPTVAVEIRSIDGTDNNLADPELGSTNEQLLRVAPADYADGVSALAGADRPSARLISDLLAAQDEEEAVPNERALSAFIYIWGPVCRPRYRFDRAGY